jgi:hypothetical protein
MTLTEMQTTMMTTKWSHPMPALHINEQWDEPN